MPAWARQGPPWGFKVTGKAAEYVEEVFFAQEKWTKLDIWKRQKTKGGGMVRGMVCMCSAKRVRSV